MTVPEMCELSIRARAFSVEALIGVKRQRSPDESVSDNTGRRRRHSQDLESSNGGIDAQQRLRLKQNLRVELCSRDLWRKFHSLGTEMIITKAGRRMFPTVKVRLSGLDPAASYIVFLDIVPVDDKRYRYVYHSSQWMVAGSGDPPLPHNLYVHPDSPATGQLWMAQGVVAFDKLKLTNNRKPLVRGQVSLHSMHKYLPRVHILQTTDLETPPEQQACVERALTYTFPETTFTTVTAYQNQQITRLKIASNPFAKGFREASRTRDSLEDSPHHRASEFSPAITTQSKFSQNDFFGLHPEIGFLPPPATMYLPGNPSYFASNSAIYHPTHSIYGCPPHGPLTLPIKFVVPPRTDNRRSFLNNDDAQVSYKNEKNDKGCDIENSKRNSNSDSLIAKFTDEKDENPKVIEQVQRVALIDSSRILCKTSEKSICSVINNTINLGCNEDQCSESLVESIAAYRHLHIHSKKHTENDRPLTNINSKEKCQNEKQSVMVKTGMNEATNCVTSPLDLTKLK